MSRCVVAGGDPKIPPTFVVSLSCRTGGWFLYPTPLFLALNLSKATEGSRCFFSSCLDFFFASCVAIIVSASCGPRACLLQYPTTPTPPPPPPPPPPPSPPPPPPLLSPPPPSHPLTSTRSTNLLGRHPTGGKTVCGTLAALLGSTTGGTSGGPSGGPSGGTTWRQSPGGRTRRRAPP